MPKMRTPLPTVGDRLRWIREAVSPFIEECAPYFGVDPATWRTYENGADLPEDFAKEVAQRFPVTLAYLYCGDLSGLEPQVRYVLLREHPELGRRE